MRQCFCPTAASSLAAGSAAGKAVRAWKSMTRGRTAACRDPESEPAGRCQECALRPVHSRSDGRDGQPYTLALVPPAHHPPRARVRCCVVRHRLHAVGRNAHHSPIQLGRIQGTPTTSGAYAFDVRVTDRLGRSSDQTLTIRVDGLDITTQFLPSAHGITRTPHHLPRRASRQWRGASSVVRFHQGCPLRVLDHRHRFTVSEHELLLQLYAEGDRCGRPATVRNLGISCRARCRSRRRRCSRAFSGTTTSLHLGRQQPGPAVVHHRGGALPPGVSLQAFGCFTAC